MKTLVILMMLVGVIGDASAACIQFPRYLCKGEPIDNVLKCERYEHISILPGGEKICFEKTIASDCQELSDTAEGVLPYLDDPNYRPGSISSVHAVVVPMPTELELAEQEVNRLKEKATAIQRFRDALRKARGER